MEFLIFNADINEYIFYATKSNVKETLACRFRKFASRYSSNQLIEVGRIKNLAEQENNWRASELLVTGLDCCRGQGRFYLILPSS